MNRKKAMLLVLGLLLLALLVILYLRRAREPVSNAAFVAAGKEAGTMQEPNRVALPLADADGGAGAFPPEREIFYREQAARDTRGAR